MMKIKIFALIMAVICVLTVFSSCGTKNCTSHVDDNSDNICDTCSEAMPVICDPHKDNNADKICDVCGLATVVITELVPPTEEKRVDMIVNPLPEKNDFSDFMQLDDMPDSISSFTEIEGEVRGIYGGRYAYITNNVEKKNGNKTTTYTEYIILDIVSGEPIYETDNKNKENVVFDFNNCFFTVKINKYNSKNDYTVYQFMTYDGKVLFDVLEEYDDVTEWTTYNYEYRDGLDYYTFDNTVYVFDAATYELVTTLDKLSLVYRPSYNYATEDYGYVRYNNTVFVYDLANWIECLYSYNIPSYYENSKVFYINDGKVLIQAEVALLNSAVSYDYIRSSQKYDLVYVVIDPAAKTATEIEFGYYITYACDYSTEETTANAFIVHPIVNDRVNTNTQYTLFTDKDFNIAACVDSNSSVTFVDENTMLIEEVIGSSYYYGETVVRKLVNATTGEIIAYINSNAQVYDKYIKYDGKYYDFTMSLILDPEEDEFTVVGETSTYLLLSKRVASKQNSSSYTTELYFFSFDGNPVKCKFENWSLVTSPSDLGYIISHKESRTNSKTGRKETVTVYSYVNNKNETVFTGDYNFYNSYSCEDAHIFYAYDETYYIVK